MEDKIETTSGESSLHAAWIFFWDLAKVFIVAFGLVWFVIRPYVAEPFIVSGSSMFPNFHNRDYLVIEKMTYHRNSPKHGEIIVFRYPYQQKQYFIKRIIGLPGDSVRIGDGKVYVTDSVTGKESEVNESYLPEGTFTAITGNASVWHLGPDQYFVMGDNRGASSDSRVWGVLPKSLIVGKAWLRVLPVGDIGLIRSGSDEQ